MAKPTPKPTAKADAGTGYLNFKYLQTRRLSKCGMQWQMDRRKQDIDQGTWKMLDVAARATM